MFLSGLDIRTIGVAAKLGVFSGLLFRGYSACDVSSALGLKNRSWPDLQERVNKALIAKM